jgi:hypothetical protein
MEDPGSWIPFRRFGSAYCHVGFCKASCKRRIRSDATPSGWIQKTASRSLPGSDEAGQRRIHDTASKLSFKEQFMLLIGEMEEVYGYNK